MRTLILFRHAKAEAIVGAQRDIDRPLAPRGWNDAPKVASKLIQAGLDVDLALVSSAKRAQETWTALAPSFGRAKLKTVEQLYTASDDGLWKLAAREDGALKSMIVAHNPSLQDLAVNILRASGDLAAKKALGQFDHLPTAGAMAFEFPEGAMKKSEAKFLGFWTP